MLSLIGTKRTDVQLLKRMSTHYSRPKGFVGRNICYAVLYDSIYFGHIVGGSATMHLPNRHTFLGTTKLELNNIVNNIFFNVSPPNTKYPIRNFTTAVVKLFVETIKVDWEEKYGDVVLGFETLVEKPRTGELYTRAGWTKVGETIGYTCKRIGGTDPHEKFTGKRIWIKDPNKLRPKVVLCLKINQ